MSSDMLLKSILLQCIGGFVIVLCDGKPISDFPLTSSSGATENSENLQVPTIGKLQNLLDKVILQELFDSGNLASSDQKIENPIEFMIIKPCLSDRIQESSFEPSAIEVTTIKSPLEYYPHRPSFANAFYIPYHIKL
ncbi:hypothetical protein HUJ04_007822 [Dendroctonus ponderosae]|nr:hypothetical protein HUJ04_007822 [Dendroctonus ponderosae]